MTTACIEPSTPGLHDHRSIHSTTEDYKDWLSNYPHKQVCVCVA